MSWTGLAAIIEAEAPEAAQRLEKAILHHMAGQRLTIPVRSSHSDGAIEDALRASGFSVASAAKELQISQATVYRRIKRLPQQKRTLQVR